MTRTTKTQRFKKRRFTFQVSGLLPPSNVPETWELHLIEAALARLLDPATPPAPREARDAAAH